VVQGRRTATRRSQCCWLQSEGCCVINAAAGKTCSWRRCNHDGAFTTSFYSVSWIELLLTRVSFQPSCVGP
jgi:hypothetical protein